jgi:hypothetical protein
MVFATQLRQLDLDVTVPAHLDGKAKTIYAATQWQRTKPPGRYMQLVRTLDSFVNMIRTNLLYWDQQLREKATAQELLIK